MVNSYNKRISLSFLSGNPKYVNITYLKNVYVEVLAPSKIHGKKVNYYFRLQINSSFHCQNNFCDHHYIISSYEGISQNLSTLSTLCRTHFHFEVMRFSNMVYMLHRLLYGENIHKFQ